MSTVPPWHEFGSISHELVLALRIVPSVHVGGADVAGIEEDLDLALVAPATQLIGVLMTGMGNDGAEAMALLHAQGGRTIAESEETAVVWGMPGELVKNGGAQFIHPVDDIAAAIIELVGANAPH